MARFPKARELWTDYYGFMPEVVASFDHLGVGLLSRIPVGYERLGMVSNGSQHVVSLVLDTIRPDSDKQCGASLGIGILPKKSTTWVDPAVFFFRNRFSVDFKKFTDELHQRLDEFLTSQADKRRREVIVKVVGMRSISALNVLFGGNVATSNEVIARRKIFMERNLGVNSFCGRCVPYSETLPAVADILQVLRADGVKLEETPYVDKYGFARYVSSDGVDEGVIRADPNWDEIIERMKVGTAIPTAPMTVLTTLVAPEFNHFGNDYGILGALNSWLGIDVRNLAGGDYQDSWPVGKILKGVPASGDKSAQGVSVYENVVVDLMHFPAELYRTFIRASARGDGSPQFERTFGDFMVV